MMPGAKTNRVSCFHCRLLIQYGDVGHYRGRLCGAAVRLCFTPDCPFKLIITADDVTDLLCVPSHTQSGVVTYCNTCLVYYFLLQYNEYQLREVLFA